MNMQATKGRGEQGQQRPVVLRFQSMFPAAVPRFKMHGDRKGQDLEHVDPERTKANTVLIGDEDWQEQLMGEIELARYANLASELDALWARKRKKEHAERLREGLKDPWRDSKGGPLREVILTAHKDWFAQADAAQPVGGLPERTTVETDDLGVILAQFDAQARASRGGGDDGGDLVDSGDAGSRQERFEACAVEWLQSRFGDAVVFARADHDEEAYHIHAVIAPWTETTTKRRGTQRMLQPSAHPLLKDYEKAQDDVGAHFSAIGLRRGERHKARWRDAVNARAAEREVAGAAQTPLPEIPEHVPPAEWRKREDAKLIARKEAEAAERAQARARERERQQELDDEQKQLQAERVAVAEKDAAAEEKAKQAVEREAKAATKAAEADEVIAVSDSFAAGKKPERPEAGAARRLYDGLAKAYRRLKAGAQTKAREEVEHEIAAERKELADERETVRAAKGAVEALMSAASKALPEKLRAQFFGDTYPAKRDADDALGRMEGKEVPKRRQPGRGKGEQR